MLGVRSMRAISRILSAAVFLTGSSDRVARRPAEHCARLGWPIMLLGALWGLAMIALWDIANRLTWPMTFNWVAPSALCAAAMVLGPYRRATLSLVEMLIPRRRQGSPNPDVRRDVWGPLAWVGVPLIALAVGLILNGALRSDPDWPTQLPRQWAWLWPRALYRVLLLAPVWGAWGMLTLGQFCRPSDRTDEPTRRFAESVHPITSAAALAIPLTGSLVYLNFLYPVHFVPPLAAIVAALGGGALLARRGGALTRPALLAANVLAQLAFLLAYLAVR